MSPLMMVWRATQVGAAIFGRRTLPFQNRVQTHSISALRYLLPLYSSVSPSFYIHIIITHHFMMWQQLLAQKNTIVLICFPLWSPHFCWWRIQHFLSWVSSGNQTWLAQKKIPYGHFSWLQWMTQQRSRCQDPQKDSISKISNEVIHC